MVWKDTKMLSPGLFPSVFEGLINKLGSFGFVRVFGDFEPVRSGFVRNFFFASTVLRSSVGQKHFQFGTALIWIVPFSPTILSFLSFSGQLP